LITLYPQVAGIADFVVA